MADHTLRKVSQSGVGYSVVDLSDVRHVFAAATPLRGTTFDQQADDALKTIEAVISEHRARGSIVHQAVFLADMANAQRCHQLMREFYGSQLPAISYIPQPPCAGKLLAIEALGVGQGRGEVQIERISEELVIARHNRMAWFHCTTVHPLGENLPAYEAAAGVLQRACRLLGSVGVGFGQVVRTWYYLGGIVACDAGNGDSPHLCEAPSGPFRQMGTVPVSRPVQRYQEFNRARTDFFQHIRFHEYVRPTMSTWCPGLTEEPGQAGNPDVQKVYPASTGIGSAGRGISMSAIAIVTDRQDIRAVPLENPRQTAACDYSAAYGPQSPKFSRAMALSCGDYATIFISGTASIAGCDTQHVGSVVRQTEETLDNIAALIAEENLARGGLPGLGTSLASLGLARVYIKRPEDYAAVRAVCDRRLGSAPTIYAIADVCRPELLVEIEGVAFSRLAHPI